MNLSKANKKNKLQDPGAAVKSQPTMLGLNRQAVGEAKHQSKKKETGSLKFFAET